MGLPQTARLCRELALPCPITAGGDAAANEVLAGFARAPTSRGAGGGGGGRGRTGREPAGGGAGPDPESDASDPESDASPAPRVSRRMSGEDISSHALSALRGAAQSRARPRPRRVARARGSAPRRSPASVADAVDLIDPRTGAVPPPPRTKWTRRVPHPVLIGHAVCLTPY